ncbi:MAG: acyl-CoA dehydrogenase family protein [Gemmatimonadetes bacterium]|nr:acyl-CoA dehydrogenase family protein [Gemmatimonadota bacterium]
MHPLLAERLAWPFFEPRHADLVAAADAWCATHPVPHHDDAHTDDACRAWVRALGTGGWLRHCVPAAWGGARPEIESRALALLREVLAYHDGLTDFALAMQGLGSGAVALEGSDALRGAWLPRVASGDAIAAFALTEPDAGSDVGAMQASATRVGDHYELSGEKTWISNGGIADFYTVFARTDPASKGARGISAFLVPAGAPGLRIAERMDVIAPHPLARLAFERCAVPATHRLGAEGAGFKLAMRTLDIFRVTVAGAALGFARRALDEATGHAASRAMFGATLAQQPLAQATLGDMATEFDAAALLTARAAWLRDTTGARTTREAAMAKLAATESAQAIIDRAVQLFGARGVQRGAMVERLYREIRALRIYEGASEVQRLIIGRDTVAARTPQEGTR